MQTLEEIRWLEQKEKADGTGRSYYSKTFYGSNDSFYTFCYFPDEDKAWVFDNIAGNPSLRFKCTSWNEANKLFEQIFNGNTNGQDT